MHLRIQPSKASTISAEASGDGRFNATSVEDDGAPCSAVVLFLVESMNPCVQEFTCAICISSPLVDPVTTPCGHSFDKAEEGDSSLARDVSLELREACYESYLHSSALRSGRRECPLCKKPVSTKCPEVRRLRITSDLSRVQSRTADAAAGRFPFSFEMQLPAFSRKGGADVKAKASVQVVPRQLSSRADGVTE